MDYESHDTTTVQLAKYREYLLGHEHDFYLVDEKDTTAVQIEKYKEYLAQQAEYKAITGER